MPGIGIGISPMLRRYRAGYGAYTTAWYTQVLANGGTATAGELAALTTFENSMGVNMIEFDRLWIHGLANSVAARVSFVNPTSTLISLVNSPTFTASQGFNGNGTTSYLNLNYNPTTNGVKLTLNSASKGTYYLATPTDNSAEGVLVTRGIYNYFSVGHFRVAVQTLSDYDSGYTRNPRLNVIYRNNSTQMYANLNGVDSTGMTWSSVALPNGNAYALCINNGGTPTSFQAEKESVNFYGSGAINFLTMYNAVQALGTTLGWAV